MKELIQNLKTATVLARFQSIYITMSYYCLKCRKNTLTGNPEISKANKGKLIILSKLGVCDSKKWRFIKKKEAKYVVLKKKLRIKKIFQ